MGKYILVIDEGTTGTRALLIDKQLQIVNQAYQEIIQYTPTEDKVEHDAAEIYEKSVDCCKKVLADAGAAAADIEAIAISNQRNTTVVWDKNTGEPLYNAIVWQDMRVAGEVDRIKQTPEFDKILQTTGKVIATHCGGLMLKWMMDNVPEVAAKIQDGTALQGTIDSWLCWKLTGGKTHATSYSNASSQGCLDIHEGKWNQWFMDYLGIPVSIFPEIKSESDDYGTTGLFGAPIPITCLVADQQSALFSQGCYEKGTGKCTNGTGTFMDINIGTQCVVAPGGLDTLVAWNLNGQTLYAVEGFESVTGSAVQFLRDGLEMITASKDTEALAASVPDTNGVYFVPALAGLITPQQDPFARGMIIGLTRGVKRAHVVRATLEAIALRTMDIIDVIENQAGIKIVEMRVDGGASQNDLLCQMMADYMNTKIVRPYSTEATGLGAAQFAGLKTGFYQMGDFEAVHKVEREFIPNMDDDARKEKYATWTEAVKRAMGWIRH